MDGETTIRVDSDRVVVALGEFRLSLEQNSEMMKQIGRSQLLSIRRTFRDSGSPADSWMPLAPSTIKGNPKVYGAGHKLLILSSDLLNSIQAYPPTPGLVVIGTNLRYARVQQKGSVDRSFGIGPRTEEQEEAKIGNEGFPRFFAPFRSRLTFGRYPRAKLAGPAREGKGSLSARLEGPRNASYHRDRLEGPAQRRMIGASLRHQNIPARPYLVFRPEDPERIQGIVIAYVNKARDAAGLGGA